jgi:mannose-6-phosphate isomerase-like protein (cupin superfamily)
MTDNPKFSVFGETIEIVVTSKSANYQMCAGIQISPPGGGPPPHRHLGEEEIFTVISGEFDLFDGERWHPLKPGDVRLSPRGQVHAFRNSGKTDGKMMFITNGGGLDEYFAEISSLRVPEDEERLNEINRHYQIEIMPLK